MTDTVSCPIHINVPVQIVIKGSTQSRQRTMIFYYRHVSENCSEEFPYVFSGCEFDWAFRRAEYPSSLASLA